MTPEVLSFVGQAILRPGQTGAIMPSSNALARQMVRTVPSGTLSTVVEVGPGTGAITGDILSRMGDPSRYVGIEPNPEFHKTLRRKYPRGTFLLDTVQSACQAHGWRARAQHVVCSLPWSLFTRGLQREVLESIVATLSRGGTFSTYLYLHRRLRASGRDFRDLMHEYFPDAEESPVVWRNMPPALVYDATWSAPAR